MSDRDALLRAIREYPDDDTPRLIFADYLDENDEGARAAFVRAQVELARTQPWEPFAVNCRWREPELVIGRGFRDSLPRVDGFHIEWPDSPFRRGFGWSLNVRTLSEWTERAAPLFEIEPIGKVSLWSGTLDDWRAFSTSPTTRRLREVILNNNPIEPLRVLRAVPDACGITDLHFRRASGAGMPVVLEELFLSQLGRTIRGLHFHTGYESLTELIEGINCAGPLERLSFSVMGMTGESVGHLLTGPAAKSLKELRFRNEPLGSDGLEALAQWIPSTVSDLELSMVGVQADGLEAIARCEHFANLRRLNLSRNPLTPRAARVLSLSRGLAGLRSLDVSQCRIGDRAVRHITRAKFWPNLVELDLRANTLSSAGVKHLLNAPVPPDLTALVLDAHTTGAANRAALTKKYGASAVFVTSELPG
ncbi:MAG: TIGR02996 domain-containing protein [Planctomycetia bacterium]|nr:TIGR02996 domain-containing protein [Planctomycetia bacterium]